MSLHSSEPMGEMYKKQKEDRNLYARSNGFIRIGLNIFISPPLGIKCLRFFIALKVPVLINIHTKYGKLQNDAENVNPI